MIISASRRTDIPAYYSDWFFNRIKAGYVLARNPMNFRQVSRIKLTPDVVDGIVFWTKNPLPMLARLNELKDYMYYFQFSLTPYGKDIEPYVRHKNTKTPDAFKKVSDIVGAERIIWRFDPILINAKYTMDYHVQAFGKIARELKGYTNRVTFSFIDVNYRGVKSNINELGLLDFTAETQIKLASSLSAIAKEYNLTIDTCGEKIDLREYGIEQARCIDDRLFSKLLSCPLDVPKDQNQRLECGCVSSVDIGMYNTCVNGCLYCYANYSKGAVVGNHAKHNPFSPLLLGEVDTDDKITDKPVKVYRGK
jgi:hypothetical protein